MGLDRLRDRAALLYSENGHPGIATCFMIRPLLLKHIYWLS
ncbi:hypothetical protein ABIF65_010526 [Bradyrhizobium japonicum]|nr:hypothetical protein [Bradyrhizobium japonicum]MCP1776220.1 hypothetical protein [Bradyrhizobium japonicum]MCP1855668.1 hypothetical protein [Bradyrhizobium japonicum]MCP1897516.1 hypothetical protein [Bradyrhizobium japonicum]MCP1960783.1 hypothetical protein [Bradyrhizobium japonicum]